MADTRCRFLELPTELRLIIYGFAVLDARVVTIGTAKLTGNAPDIVHRQFGANRSPFTGIPRHSEPVVETHFDAALLSGKATIESNCSTQNPPVAFSSWSSHQSLLRLNRQVNGEIRSHFALPVHRQTNLFVSYPHGLHFLQTTTPELLLQSRSVHVCGSYIPRISERPRRGGATHYAVPEELEGDVVPDAVGQLSKLVKDTFGSNASHPVEKLELRIYYPGDSYSTVWSDTDSPIGVALYNIGCAEIDMVVYRGRYGNGVHLTATPVTERKRVITTVWYVYVAL